ncbi:endonuclease/exonuclease/phosphatase family protein [Dactylosporangium sp. NPDC051485]|uniref:endonuclease/exonuclease/phosphatase family protein n=1 Tax=Dactylosporangium sp. NPDC051485 TaxID=3154846 RepID=UPI003420A6E6
MTTMVSINALDLYGAGSEEDERRYAGVEALLRELDADIVAVQELRVPGPAEHRKAQARGAAVRLRRLAEAVGRRCDTGARAEDLLLAVGGGVHHVGLLWHEDSVAPVPGRVQRFGRAAGMWHSLVTAVFDLGDGVLARAGSVHLPPFDQNWAVQDTSQILRAMHGDDLPGFVGGDFNNIGATKVRDPSTGELVFYDADPYAGLPWQAHHVYQLDADGDVDRRAAHRLEAPHLGRLQDCAILTDTPWTPTTGHHPDDRHPPRRLDRWYATHRAPGRAVRRYQAVAAARVGGLTDHCPVIIDVDPAAMTGS